MSLTRSEAIHLWNRVGFGPGPEDVDTVLSVGVDSFIEEQVSGKVPEPELDRSLAAIPGIAKTIVEIVEEHQRQNQSREPIERALMDLRVAKIVRAVRSPNQLREVMVDFWFNHFNVFAYSWEPSLPSYERNAIRPHVLGRFRDLLGAVAHDPSMMFFLDTYTNVADRTEGGKRVRGLNENYARELLELHTVGVDAGYTQTDITEAAKVFTGWTIGGWGTRAPSYEFEFVQDRHDWSSKSVFGLELSPQGEDEGERLLDFLASHPRTARFISTKLVRRFVADDPPVSLVERCATAFLDSGGDIRTVLRTIFVSPEFWSLSHRENKFKTPFEFVVSALRATDAELTYPEGVAVSLEGMGMPLYEAKPPTGYASDGGAWMNPSSQVYRFDFAFGLVGDRVAGVSVPGRRADRRRLVSRVGAPPVSDEERVLRVLELFSHSIIGDRLTQTTRQQVLEVRSSGGVDASAKAIGLLLASPEFGVR